MSISEQSLGEFKRLYQEEFKEVLGQEDLERKARIISRFYLAIYRSPVDVVKDAEKYLSEEC